LFKNNLELIIGPVCSGKSTELIRKIKRYQIAGFNILLVKPRIDSRSNNIRSRNGSELDCHELDNISDIYNLISKHEEGRNNINEVRIIALDEAQFYDNLFPIVRDLLLKGYKVVISALDSDFNGNPFGDIPKLLILSDTVERLTSVCMECKNDNAIFSQKLKKGGGQIEVGDLELYHPRCLNCFIPGGVE
jgi:thymidine kinase